ALATLGAEERRLGDVDVAVLDDLRELPVEERQEQRPDVRAVHIRVGHDDDPVVAELLDVEVLDPDAAAERGDHRLDLVAAEHLVEPGLLDVQNLPLERQDGLEATIASLLGRPPCRLALDDVQLAQGRIPLLAIRELSWKGAAVQGALAAHQIARLPGRLAGPCGIDRLADDAAGHRGVFLEIGAEPVVENRLDDALDLGVSQLGLGLPLELRVRNLDADDAGEPFADVFAGDAL